ncbi:stage II sporulation protein R [Bacillus sp. WP8]
MYGNLVYGGGKYEGILIRVGEGEGGKWWCVLLARLCFMDF